jgi:hypothetical protein
MSLFRVYRSFNHLFLFRFASSPILLGMRDGNTHNHNEVLDDGHINVIRENVILDFESGI